MKMKKQLGMVALAATVIVMVACEEMGVPRSGTPDTVVVPPSIIGRVLVIHFNGQVRSDPICTAGSHNPRTGRLWFVDESTIRGVRDDGTFDYATERWEYEKTSSGGTVEIWWESAGHDRFDLTFEDSKSGTFIYTNTSIRSNSCGETETGTAGEFELADPP